MERHRDQHHNHHRHHHHAKRRKEVKCPESAVRRTPELTPVPADLEKRVLNAVAHKKRPCVLVNTGSYCPVHQGHVNLLVSARDFLHAHTDYEVVAAYLSPSHDAYVQQKSKRFGFEDLFIPFHHRCAYIEKTLENRPESDAYGLLLDAWEGSHKDFIDSFAVCCTMRGYYNHLCRSVGSRVTVIMCQGQDMLKTSDDEWHNRLIFRGKKMSIPLVIIQRDSDASTGMADRVAQKVKHVYEPMTIDEMREKDVYFVRVPGNGVSSTLVRDLIYTSGKAKTLSQEDVKRVMDVEVLEEIKSTLVKDK